jgi:hypothetical protein
LEKSWQLVKTIRLLARIVDSSSKKHSQLFIGAYNETPSVVAVRVNNPDVSPWEWTAETQPQLQPALLRLSAINFAVPLLRTGLCHFRSPRDKDNAIGNLFHTAASINVSRIFAGIAQLVRAADL